MARWLPIAACVLALAEIVVFVSVAHVLGAGWALLILSVCTLVGAVLLRREGIRGWRAFRAAADEGRPPGAQVSNSLVGLGGALLFALPGFLSSLAGLLLLVPPLRGVARRQLEGYAERQMGAAVAGDLFGPRWVRARRGAPVDEPEVVRAEPVRTPPAAAIEGEVVEGEVLR